MEYARPCAERRNNIVRRTEYDRGGTFPATEVPDPFTAAAREFRTSHPR